jgi:uncharacterized protein (TIGR03000 family)
MRHHLSVGLLVLVMAGTSEARGEGIDRTLFRILVPEDAFVFVACERMQSTGPERYFESPALQPGRRYCYVISVIHEGQEVVRRVRFEAGGTVIVDFRDDCERLTRPDTAPTRPYKPIRPVWLPGRVYRA